MGCDEPHTPEELLTLLSVVDKHVKTGLYEAGQGPDLMCVILSGARREGGRRKDEEKIS